MEQLFSLQRSEGTSEQWKDVSLNEFRASDYWASYKKEIQKESKHFSIILLNKKDGSGPSQTLEKSGTTPVKITNYLGVIQNLSPRQQMVEVPLLLTVKNNKL